MATIEGTQDYCKGKELWGGLLPGPARAGRMPDRAGGAGGPLLAFGQMMTRRTVLFTGRVQGVGFRYATCRIAADFRVTGYVHNLPDGRVEAVVEGEEGEVSSFVGAVREAMSGYIRQVSVAPGGGEGQTAATGEFSRFEIRF